MRSGRRLAGRRSPSRRCTIGVLALGALGALAATARAQGTGLRLATPEELRGIPFASTPYSGTELPARVDLSPDMPVPGNQGRQNSCVAWVVGYALKTYEERVEERLPLFLPSGQADLSRHFSPAFIYNQLNGGRDGGVSYLDALRFLHERGDATLADMPYVEGDYWSQPSSRARSAAMRYRIDFWRQVNVADPVELKAHLNAGYPVLIGAIVDEGFRRAGPGFVWRAQSGASLGAHAMIVVGYDDAHHAFRLLNSWGRSWGDGGYAWVDYDFFPRVVREGYVVKDAANGPAPIPTPTPTPTPPPPSAAATFSITEVTHNVYLTANDPVMLFKGSLSVPPGMSGFVQVVIHVYFDAGDGTKGAPVASLRPQYATVHATAATGTPPITLTPTGVTTNWWAALPYFALYVARGGPSAPVTTNLVAEPVLYINNFGVRSGGLIRFKVTL